MSLSRAAPKLRHTSFAFRQITQRRCASTHDAPATSATHGGHADPGHGTESFGRSFYFVVLLVPVSMGVYAISRDARNGEANPITQLLERYSDWREVWARRSGVHTRMVEQAGQDRNLFLNSPNPNWHDLRMPEMFNAGSPCAVPAGHNVNLEHVMEHYRRRNERDDLERGERDERRRREEWRTSR
ncbi:MAG: hypothetical protein Q9159_003907 [Coniocarpon cinnabarinum]